jgi:isocitrate/isopropylmalate dehydrogenase
VIPALNRDGDSLSELVLGLFGSVAGAESVLLAFDRDFRTRVVMTEAPHGTAPALEGKNIANPMAMILAVGALLQHVAERSGSAEAERASRAVYEAVLEAAASGVRTPDIGGHATTTEFTDEVIARVRTKIEIWSSL